MTDARPCVLVFSADDIPFDVGPRLPKSLASATFFLADLKLLIDRGLPHGVGAPQDGRTIQGKARRWLLSASCGLPIEVVIALLSDTSHLCPSRLSGWFDERGRDVMCARFEAAGLRCLGPEALSRPGDGVLEGPDAALVLDAEGWVLCASVGDGASGVFYFRCFDPNPHALIAQLNDEIALGLDAGDEAPGGPLWCREPLPYLGVLLQLCGGRVERLIHLRGPLLRHREVGGGFAVSRVDGGAEVFRGLPEGDTPASASVVIQRGADEALFEEVFEDALGVIVRPEQVAR